MKRHYFQIYYLHFNLNRVSMSGWFRHFQNLYDIFNGTISYQPNKHENIFCELLPFTLPRFEDVARRMEKYNCNLSTYLQGLVSSTLGLFYSKEGCRILNSDWTGDDKQFLEQVYVETLEMLNHSDLCSMRNGDILYKTSLDYFGRLYALKYDGTDSNFGWHYDSLGPEEYRAIFTVRQRGSRRFALAYQTDEHSKVFMRPPTGGGVLIRSGETFHAVLPDPKGSGENDVERTERWVIVFTYTTIKDDSREYLGAVDKYFRKK